MSATGDLDGDGQPDTVIGIGTKFEVRLTRRRSWSTQLGNSGNASTGILDIDGDHNPDTYRCDCGDGYVVAFYGNGAGKFSTQRFLIDHVNEASFFDVNNDGQRDLLYRAWPEKEKLMYFTLKRL